MSAPPSVLTGMWMPVALGGAAGAVLAWTSEVYGATPLALVGVLAVACIGASVGTWLRPGQRTLSALIGVAGVAAVAAPGLAAALPSPVWTPVDAPTWIGSLASFAVGLALSAASRTGTGLASRGRWAGAALAVLAGVNWPAIGAGVAAVLALLHVHLPQETQEAEDWRPAPGALALVAVLLSVALASAGWNTVRASLDPTVGGAAVALAAGLLTLGTARGARRRMRPGSTAPLPLVPVAGAGLVLLLLLGAWPERSWQLLSSTAGRSDPRLVLWALLGVSVVPGAAAAGWVLGRHRLTRKSGTALWLTAAGGLLLGLDQGPDLYDRLIGLAALAGIIGLLQPGGRSKVQGLALLGGALAVLWTPLPWHEARFQEGRVAHLQDRLAPDRHASRVAAATPAAAGWGPGGGVLLLRRPDRSLLHISEGWPLEREGRAADAERMAGHLARALAPRFDRALALGDDQGLVTASLLEVLVERTTVVVSNPEAVRALAEADPMVSAALLHPTVSLVRGGREQVLRSVADQDIVVEVARTPWTDGSQGLPGPRQLRARRDVLEGRQGLYLLVVDVTRLDETAFRGLLADVLSVFPETWACLPPRGADQLLLASWTGDARAHWDQFLAVETIARESLSAIGLGSALDLADRLAVGPGGLATLAQGGVSPRSPWLPDDLHGGPYLSPVLLEPSLEGSSGLLDVGPLTRVTELLEERVFTKRSFLRLLAGAVRGDQAAVFEESRRLLGQDGGAETLDPLIAPYLDRARELLRQARPAGLGSSKWSQALAELEAARLMNPRSTEVLAMLADTHLSLGNVPKAETLYQIVLELDPGHLQALLGQAQASLVMDRYGEAEDSLRQAVERNVRSWIAHHNMGEFLANAHQYPDAERHLKLAIDLSNGTIAAPFAALSTVYLEQGDIAASLLQASRALTLEDTAEHRYLVARAHYELENFSLAVEHAQRGALRSPGHLGCHFILGLIQGRRGQHEQCARTFKRVLELQPGSEPAIKNLRQCQEAADSAAAAEPE